MPNKKTVYSIVILLASFTQFSSQTPNYLWANSAGGTGWDYGRTCTTDANNNIIVAGSFASTSLTIGTTTLTKTGFENVIVAKYDPNGNVLWAKSAGGTKTDVCLSANVDLAGNIVLVGYFFSPTFSIGTTNLINSDATGNTADIFILKLDQNGNIIWAKSSGGTGRDWALRSNIDLNGNILVTGFFENTITFGTNSLTSSGSNDVFIVKYDPTGTVLWAKKAGGSAGDTGIGCAIDASGNVILTGYFLSSSISFGTINLSNANTSGNTYDIFVAKYDSNGILLWAQRYGGTDSDNPQSCCVDASDNIIVTGYFYSSTLTLGTNTLINAAASFTDLFIVKYSPSGNVLWANSVGGNQNDYGIGCTTDANSNIIITGYYASSLISFGTTTFSNTSGASDLFICKFNTTGSINWAKSASSIGTEVGSSCTVDLNNNIIVTGHFTNSPFTVGTNTLTNSSNGQGDIFVLKLDGLTGIEEFNNKNSIIAFPNPSTGKINLSFNILDNNKIEAVKIYNTLGECIYTIENITNDYQIDLSAVSSGVYFIELCIENKTAIKKIVINH